MCIAYPLIRTLTKPKLGLHTPSANGESFAKNRAVENRTANIVQNLFSNSCALCTPWDSFRRKTDSVYSNDTTHDQNIGATANRARNINNKLYGNLGRRRSQ